MANEHAPRGLDEGPTSPSSYIASVELEGASFARAAEGGPLDVPIAACPGWDMGDLVRHLGEIHLWAAANVAYPKPKWLHVGELTDLADHWPDLASGWPDDDDLVTWYRATHANLVDVLRSTPPERRGVHVPAGGDAVDDVGASPGERDRHPPLRRGTGA